MVRHEEGVELAALERLRETRQMLEVEVRIGIRARITPRRRVDADGAHESAQTQLTRAAHASFSSSSSNSLRLISCRKRRAESNVSSLYDRCTRPRRKAPGRSSGGATSREP